MGCTNHQAPPGTVRHGQLIIVPIIRTEDSCSHGPIFTIKQIAGLSLMPIARFDPGLDIPSLREKLPTGGFSDRTPETSGRGRQC